jgi:hypothetical protein
LNSGLLSEIAQYQLSKKAEGSLMLYFTYELGISAILSFCPALKLRAPLMISAPKGQGALLKNEHTLPKSTTLLYCKLTAFISGNAFEVKNVGEERDSCSNSSSVTACNGPGTILDLGSRVETSFSGNEDAQPVHAAARRSQVKASQKVCALL